MRITRKLSRDVSRFDSHFDVPFLMLVIYAHGSFSQIAALVDFGREKFRPRNAKTDFCLDCGVIRLQVELKQNK